MKIKIITTLLLLSSCTTARFSLDSTVKSKQDNTLQALHYEKSYDLGYLCPATAILYGGYCWAYLGFPNEEQKAAVIKDLQTKLNEKYGVGNWELNSPPLIQKKNWEKLDEEFSFPALKVSNKIKAEERNAKYEFATGVSAQEAFSRSKKWLAKNLNNSNYTIKMENEKTNELVAKFGIECGNEEFVKLTFELNFKNNKGRVIAEDISSENYRHDVSIQDYGHYPNSLEQLEYFKNSCLDPVVQNLKTAISKKDDW